MPTAEKPKPAKPTWLDWHPEGAPLPELLPHDELLARLRDRGVDLSSTALEYYRHRNILPRPIRRRYEGLTQALYPDWFVPVIQAIKDMQTQGKSLDEIRDAIGPVMTMWAINTVPWEDPLAAPTATVNTAIREYVAALQPWEHGGEIRMARVTFFDDVGNELPDFKHEIPVQIDSGYDSG